MSAIFFHCFLYCTLRSAGILHSSWCVGGAHPFSRQIGGATGSIGDPSGRSSERSVIDKDVLETNVASISTQICAFFLHAREYLERRSIQPAATHKESVGGAPILGDWADVRLVNNLDWTRNVTLLDFLGTVGRHARMGDILARDRCVRGRVFSDLSVRTRLEPSAGNTTPAGLSFTELSYQLLQAYDFSVLHAAPWHCSIQVGGSDQMGNIAAGIDLIRRQGAAKSASPQDMHEQPAYGLTLPLLTTANGAKFGKSAGNAVWTSPALLSDYDFYQYFMRAADSDVGKYLRSLTLLPLTDIEEILETHASAPSKRVAQRKLAEEMTELVRGLTAVHRAKVATEVLFARDLHAVAPSEVLEVFGHDTRLVHAPRSLIGKDIVTVLTEIGLARSRGEARRLVMQGGCAINGGRVGDAESTLAPAHLIHDAFSVFRSGKTNHKIVVYT